MPLTSHYENIVERRYENDARITDERLAPNYKHTATPEPPKRPASAAPFRLTHIDNIILQRAEIDPEHLSLLSLRWMKARWTPAHYKALGERSLDALSRLAAVLAASNNTAQA